MKIKALKYDLFGAYETGVVIHPCEDMSRLGVYYYRGVPESLFDCWLFLVREWPSVELPKYITKIELDDNTFTELKI